MMSLNGDKNMPNWCSNTLMVQGSGKPMDKFIKQCDMQEDENGYGGQVTELLSKFYPMPIELSDQVSGACTIDGKKVRVWRVVDGENVAIDEKTIADWKKRFGTDNWWDWCVNNWGTKWDVTAEEDWRDDEVIHLRFESAWSPPVAWLEQVAAQFPKLTFKLKYEEEGYCFMGLATGKDGSVTDECISYD